MNPNSNAEKGRTYKKLLLIFFYDTLSFLIDYSITYSKKNKVTVNYVFYSLMITQMPFVIE